MLVFFQGACRSWLHLCHCTILQEKNMSTRYESMFHVQCHWSWNIPEHDHVSKGKVPWPPCPLRKQVHVFKSCTNIMPSICYPHEDTDYSHLAFLIILGILFLQLLQWLLQLKRWTCPRHPWRLGSAFGKLLLMLIFWSLLINLWCFWPRIIVDCCTIPLQTEHLNHRAWRSKKLWCMGCRTVGKKKRNVF